MLLEDSDEELETDISEDSEFEIDASSGSDSDGLGGTAEERLERIVGKTMTNLGFDFQVSSATKDLSGR